MSNNKLTDHDINQLQEQCKEQLTIIANYHAKDIIVLNVLSGKDLIPTFNEVPIINKIRKIVSQNLYMSKILLDRGLHVEFCYNQMCNKGFKHNEGVCISVEGSAVEYYCSVECLKLRLKDPVNE